MKTARKKSEAHHPGTSDDKPVIERDEIFENDPERDKALPRRRLVRERVLQLLYAFSMNPRDMNELFVELVLPQLPDEEAIEFARNLTREIDTHRQKINDLITLMLQHWALGRIALIDRLLLQIGIAEFLYFPEIPPKATINELIEVAKDFSTPESGKFINGILHATMTHLSEQGELAKSGRGLVDK